MPQTMIQRKPVPGAKALVTGQQRILDNVMGATKPSKSEAIVNVVEIDAASLEGESRPDLDKQLDALDLKANALPDLSEKGAEGDSSQHSLEGKSSKLKASLNTAFSEAKYFAGGLISRPYEATKHYAVLRHSLGLVFYHGPTTSIAITIFSKQPLPDDRTLWLQKRGFSGKTGLAVGAALGSRSAWIDVTPEATSTVDLLPKADERAWQRDMKRFLKNARNTKHVRDLRPCEICIVRIPHLATDGYFRVVVCSGRKVLCPSPVFRYASSSTDPGLIRGASLCSLPLELGVKVGTNVANRAVNTATANVLQPAVTTVHNKIVHSHLGGKSVRTAATAYESFGGAQRVEDINQEYLRRRELSFQTVVNSERNDYLIGGEEGPEQPFPISLSSRVVQGSGRNTRTLGVPTANLAGIDELILLRLSGVYAAWAKIQPSKSLENNASTNVWHAAILRVASITTGQAEVVERRSAAVHLVHDFKGATFYGSKMKVMIMGFIRPLSRAIVEDEAALITMDIAVCQASLSRPAWKADTVLGRIRTQSSNRSLSERAADVRAAGQKQIDKVPVHWLGIRTESMGLQDQLIGNGGLCVPIWVENQ